MQFLYGHWTHNQTYYNEQRYSLIRDLGLEIHGDSQDQEEDIQRHDAKRTFELIQGKPISSDKHETYQQGPNGPILDWLNRTQRRNFAKSVVGTSQYMAPEVIRGENYDGRCDWWSIGIILYEVAFTVSLSPSVSNQIAVSLRLHAIFLREQTGH